MCVAFANDNFKDKKRPVGDLSERFGNCIKNM